MKIDSSIKIIRTNTKNSKYMELVKNLDAELRKRFGEEQDKYDKLNIFKETYNAVIVKSNNKAVGSGAWRKIDDLSVEIKRMYVIPEFRSKGMASRILNELESWAKEEGFKEAVLECGIKQPEAIGLYRKQNYIETQKYGEYINLPMSMCFRKKL